MSCGLVLTYRPEAAEDAAKETARLLRLARVPFDLVPDADAERMKLANCKQELDLATVSAETLRAAAHSKCSTPVVPLGTGNPLQAVIDGFTFRYEELALSPGDSKEEGEVSPLDRQPRKITMDTLLDGIIVMGKPSCGYTQHAVDMLHKAKLPFYYINVNNMIGKIHDNLEPLLTMNYEYDPRDRGGDLHNTVPIVVHDRKMLGGARQLEYALNSDDLTEQLRASAKAATAGCTFVPTSATIDDVMPVVQDALETSGIVRTVITI